MALSITQPSEAILTIPNNIKVLITDILQGLSEMKDRTGVGTGYCAGYFVVFIPRSAFVGPDGASEVFLLVGVEVGDG